MQLEIDDHEVGILVDALAEALQRDDGGGNEAWREQIRALLRKIGGARSEVGNGSATRAERASS